MLRVGVFLTCQLLFASAVHAEGRVALVIGNAGYQYTPKLANPKNDAADIVATLRKFDFRVLEGFDLDKAAFDRKIRDFAVALKGATVGVFFYAGHGLQVTGQNYLVPIDAQLDSASALDFEMVRLDLIQRTMERETSTNILFLDACRDNPLARNLARSMGTRSVEIGRGLAPVESGIGTLISFSTQPGNFALDGAGRNSPFAGALVKHLSAVNDDLSAILIAVRNDVMKETQRKQVPWEHSSLTGRFYFDPAQRPTAPGFVSPARLSEAADAWAVAKSSKNEALLEAFIERFGETFFADLARGRLEELRKQRIADTEKPTSGAALPSPKSTPKKMNAGSGTSSAPQAAWVKLCEKSTATTKDQDGRETKKDLNICLTHHERLDGNTGMVLVSAAVRQVEGQDKQHFMVMVPLGMMIQPGMRASIYPRDLWQQVQNDQKVDESKLKGVRLPFTLCHPAGCTAEIEATPELMNDLKGMGGLVVLAINPTGKPVGFPVPLSGFEPAYEGPPVDNKKYGEARKVLIQQIAERQKQLGAEASKSSK